MGCRHGNGPADHCSQCLGVPARRVDQDGPLVTIDGTPAGRALDIEATSARRYYAKRGGNAMRGSKT